MDDIKDQHDENDKPYSDKRNGSKHDQEVTKQTRALAPKWQTVWTMAKMPVVEMMVVMGLGDGNKQ